MPPKPKQQEQPHRPHHPAEYEIADVSAIQALMRGNANEQQQKRAIDWIIRSAADTYELTFIDHDEGGRASAFAAGKAFVGQQIVKISKLDLALLKQRQEKPNS